MGRIILESTRIKTVGQAKACLNKFKNNTVDVLVVSTNFNPGEKYDHSIVDLKEEFISQRMRNTEDILNSGFRILKNGGLLFVYGLPKWLPHLAVFLDSIESANSKMIFKNWIAIDLDQRPRKETLERMQPSLTGNYYLPRESKHYKRSEITKKEVEIGYIELCNKKGRLIKLQEVEELNPDLFEKITTFYKNFKRLKKIARRRLEIHSII